MKKVVNLMMIVLSLLLLVYLGASSELSSTCTSSSCKYPSSSGQLQPLIIRFPFTLNSSSGCATYHYLSCNSLNQTLLTLPNSPHAPFLVHAIDYARHTIWLNDPAGCLPNLLLTLNLSNSPFTPIFYQDFTLFKCPTTIADLISIDCFTSTSSSDDANHTQRVYATSSNHTLVMQMKLFRCVPMATISVPVNWDIFQPDVNSDLREDIRLMWGDQNHPGEEEEEECGGGCEWQCGKAAVECTSTNHFVGHSKSSHISPTPFYFYKIFTLFLLIPYPGIGLDWIINLA